MSAQFTTTALNFALWKGNIRFLGHRRRPWLCIQRSELELPYLKHQLTTLRRAYVGKLESCLDPVPRESFYDDYLLMVHCPELQRVYDILYHRDVKTITPEVLALAGSGGLVSLWCDRGTSSRRRISFHGLRKAELAMKVAIWLERLGYPVAAPGLYAPGRVVRLDEASTAKLAKDLYPLVHSSMRKGLLHGER